MLIVLIARDRPGQLSLRQEVRAAHLDYLRSTGVVTQAGPLIDDAGEMCGSLLVLELPDLAAAERWAAEDPYAQAGLFESVELLPWKKVI